MAKTTEQQCLNCGAPAVPSANTVPLCEACLTQANDKRGVRYDKKKRASVVVAQ